MLAKRIQDVGAELIGFGISDAVGSPATGDIAVPYAAYKSTPIGPDATTLDDARATIVNYDVADRLPKSVVDYLMNAGPDKETPKAFPNNTYFLLNTLPDSCIYAREICEEMGIPAIIISSFLEGESKDAGTFFASMAREIQTYGNPVKAPCVLLSSGEVTTQILDNSVIRGHGGPGQEMTISFAITAAKTKGACLLSIDSEGTDGRPRWPAASPIPPVWRLLRKGHQSPSDAARAQLFRGARRYRLRCLHRQHRHQPVRPQHSLRTSSEGGPVTWKTGLPQSSPSRSSTANAAQR